MKRKIGKIKYEEQSKILWGVPLDDGGILLYFNEHDVEWFMYHRRHFLNTGFRYKRKPRSVHIGERCTVWFKGSVEDCQVLIKKLEASDYFTFVDEGKSLSDLKSEGVFDLI